MPRVAVIRGTGSYLPDNIVNNEDLPNFPPTLVKLIRQKTGVCSRRFAHESQCTSDLAAEAAKASLVRAGVDPRDLNGIILATSSPDRLQPATATRVQHLIGASGAFAFDVNSVCSGGVFALALANACITSGLADTILVVAAEIYSRYLDPHDFSTYPYFGDGAGAVLLAAAADTQRGILHSILRTSGNKSEVIQVPAGGTMLPYARLTNPKDVFFKMVGREVYDFAMTRGGEVIDEILQATGVDRHDIKFYLVHQANINIIREIATRLGVEEEKFIINLDKYGNTAAASVLICLDELAASGAIQLGDLIVIAAFGGGLSWGANLIRY
jgi:3-oxoacyl-[acyl-carrier-protein] synthase III